MIAENGGGVVFFLYQGAVAVHLRLDVKNVVAQYQADFVVVDEVAAENKGFGNTVGGVLHFVLQV